MADNVNATIETVAATKDAWAKLPVAEKVTILQQLKTNLEAATQEWIRLDCEQHKYELNNPNHAHLVGELYLVGPTLTACWVNSYIHVYTALRDTGAMPKITTTPRSDGSLACKVFPYNTMESIFAGGQTCELFLAKGVQLEQTSPVTRPAGVEALLGAGNYQAPVDILSVLFSDNRVAIFKASPVNEKINPVVQRVFQPLMSHPAGPFVGFVNGGPEVGTALLNHPLVDSATLTGGIHTYNRIMWGNKTEKKGTPVYTKPLRAELGGVNPVIYVPGVWTPAELEAHAQQLVVSRMTNGGHVCAASQVYLTSRHWAQREQFAARVKELFQQYPGVHNFYPNIGPSYHNHESNPKIAPIPVDNKLFDNQFQPLFALDCPQDCEAVKTEAFCPVLVEVVLDSREPEEFLREAVEFANTKCNGTLVATLVVDTATHKAHKAAVDDAVNRLEFGSVGLNQTGMMGIMFAGNAWGGFPKTSPEDIKSGLGWLGNCYGIEGVVKTVTTHSFTFPAQMKVPTNRAFALKQQQRLNAYLTNQTAGNLFMLIWNSITGL